MGEPARDPEPPLAYPFDLPLTFPWHPLESFSRSELSKEVVDDVADSTASFCSAFRRIFREALYHCQYIY